MSHYFTLPSAYGQTFSVRARQYQDSPKIKRKADSNSEHDSDHTNVSHLTRKTLSKDQEEAFRTAGLSVDDDIPPSPFPHAPARSRTAAPPRTTDRKLQHDLAQLEPPLFAPGAAPISELPGSLSENTSNLKQRHLGVLTTILHRCLTEGDYPRAGRAWGLLLRSRVQNHSLNLRNDGRWGIGAEVLLQTRPYSDPFDEQQSNSDMSDHSHSNSLPTEQSIKPLFSPEGFQAARDYYEYLIIQFPARKESFKSAVNASKFYPAMFSLWIYEVTERSKKKRYEWHKANSSNSDPAPASANSESDLSDVSSSASHGSKGHKQKQSRLDAQVRQEELVGAREIADRLDSQFSKGPPYDKDVDLLQLRGMVHLWIGDLMLKPASNEVNDKDGDSDDIMQVDEEDEITNAEREHLYSRKKKREPTRQRRDEAQREYEQGQTARKSEVKLAIKAFEKAQSLGADVYSQLESLSLELNEDGSIA